MELFGGQPMEPPSHTANFLSNVTLTLLHDNSGNFTLPFRNFESCFASSLLSCVQYEYSLTVKVCSVNYI